MKLIKFTLGVLLAAVATGAVALICLYLGLLLLGEVAELGHWVSKL